MNESNKLSVGCTVRYKGKIRKVEYIGYMRGELMVKLSKLSGLIPVKEVRAC